MMTRHGQQLLLELRGERYPWPNTSPRALTRAYEKFTLKAQAAGGNGLSTEEDELLEEMCRRHHYGY